jgi:serine/threonine protein phosphatase PrpC
VEAGPDVARVDLEPRRDDFLVLGSDGLFERMDAARVVGVVRNALISGGAWDGENHELV